LENKGRETYRKESTLARNPANPRPILVSSPTNVESRGALRIDDYRKKQIKEAEPFPPLSFKTAICFTPNRLST
jgi:hypothetical protein